MVRFRPVTNQERHTSFIELMKEAHSESRLKHIPFSTEKAEKIVLKATRDKKKHLIIVAEVGRVPIGFAACSIGEYYLGKDAVISTIHAVYVSPKIRKTLISGRISMPLLKRVATWSRARGAKEILLHVTSQVDIARTHNIAQKLGFNLTGGNYALKL